MLAAKYHLAYWAAAFSAAAVYQQLLHVPGMIHACRMALPPLAIYTIRASWLWSFCECGQSTTDRRLYIHQAAVAYLLVALGSVTNYYQLPGGGYAPAVLMHALFAFTTVGTLESLRQNRNEIEPRSLGIYFGFTLRFDLETVMKHNAASEFTFRAVASMLGAMIAVFLVTFGVQLSLACGILQLVDRVYDMSLWPTFPLIRFDHQVLGRFGTALATLFILTPFLDLAETLYYILLWRFIKGRPGWVRKPEPLIAAGYPAESGSVQLEIVNSAKYWVAQVVVHYLLQLCLRIAGLPNMKAIPWVGQFL